MLPICYGSAKLSPVIITDGSGKRGEMSYSRTGWVTCGRCNGQRFVGKRPCSYCDGTGVDPTKDILAHPLSRACSHCSARGFFPIPCSECHGQGEVKAP